MEIVQVREGLYTAKGFEDTLDINMGSRQYRKTYCNQAAENAVKMLTPYDVDGKIVLLPDLTDASSLPVGTTAMIKDNRKIDPTLIGMDIGCGYRFAESDIRAKKILKKGKFNERKAQTLVDNVSEAISERRIVPMNNLTNILKYGDKGFNMPAEGNFQAVMAAKGDDIQKYFGSLGRGNHLI